MVVKIKGYGVTGDVAAGALKVAVAVAELVPSPVAGEGVSVMPKGGVQVQPVTGASMLAQVPVKVTVVFSVALKSAPGVTVGAATGRRPMRLKLPLKPKKGPLTKPTPSTPSPLSSIEAPSQTVVGTPDHASVVVLPQSDPHVLG